MRWIGFFAVLLISARAVAEEAPKLEVKLISETRGVVAGKTSYVGLHFKHPLAAHTYWKHPGIVGLPTEIKWELPTGFVAGEIEWPMPQVVKMATYEAQGYEGVTLLMIPITAPAELAAGTVTLKAKVSWMCCGKVCEPAVDVPFSLTLPVNEVVEKDPATGEMFEKSRALVPQRKSGWEATAKREGQEILLSLKIPAGEVVRREVRFFAANGQVDSDREQAVEWQDDGSLRMKLFVAETGPKDLKTLSGVLIFSGEGETLAIEINAKTD